MISIIICSIKDDLLLDIVQNIKETIGVPYEIIAIDNSLDNDGICTVYNKGGTKSSFPILCFVHEDVSFQTQNWGRLVLQHFDDPHVGLIGVAGGDTKGIVPSSWSSTFRSKEMNIVQFSNGDSEGEHIFMTATGKPKRSSKVVTLDGVFLCARRDVFEQFKFDEERFKGFHSYDSDYSLQIFRKYNVLVVFDILINHYSTGKPGREWVESAFAVTKKWRKYLPLSVYPLTKEEFNFYHWKSLQMFLDRLFYLDYPFYQIVFYYLSYSFTRYFKMRRFLSMGKFVIQSVFKKTDMNQTKTEKHPKPGRYSAINYN